MTIDAGQQAVRNTAQSWGQPPRQHRNPGQAIHHWHYPYIREALAHEPAIPWPVMEIGDGESELSVALFGLWEAEAARGFAAGPGWLRVPMRGFRPSPYWSGNVQTWEQRGTEKLPNNRAGFDSPSRYACPGVVLPGENPPPWFDIRQPAPTRDELWAVWREKLHQDDYQLLADALPGGPTGPSEPPEPEPEPDTCVLELKGGRFEVTAAFRHGNGHTRWATAHPLTDSTGALWFFSPDNLELFVKVLDGVPTGSRFWWVYFGSLTDVFYVLTVTDTVTGRVKTYESPGPLTGLADVEAFPA